MRVVGIVLLLSVVSAACALQPADGGSDEAMSGSGTQVTSATATVSGSTTGLAAASDGTHGNSSTGATGQMPDPGSQSLTPGVPPQCQRPPCDPQPQPWSNRPIYLSGATP